MNTSEIKLLIIEGLIGAYERDQRTTPEVVRIVKVSNIVSDQRGSGFGVLV